EEILVGRELERVADPVVGVEADAVAIAGEDEEEVERALSVGQRREEAFVQEAVGEEGEATLDAADAVRPRRSSMRRWPSAGGGHVRLRRRGGAAGGRARSPWRRGRRRVRGRCAGGSSGHRCRSGARAW